MDRIEAVDAHHHLWDLEANSYPWLSPERGADPFPDFDRLCRDYLVADFQTDVAGQAIVKSVHVQAEHDEADPVRETAWLQSVAEDPASRGFPHAIVAWADLADDGVEAILEGHARFANVRGIRQMLNFTPPDASAGDDGGVLGKHGNLLENGAFHRNFPLLQKYDLSFDLQIFPWQTEAGARLVGAHPDTQFVLNHTIMPFDRTDEGLRVWRDAARTYAGFPHVAIKISGLAMAPGGWDPETNARLVRETIEIFGPERCLFASNFPVDKLMTSYDAIWNLFREVAGAFSRDEQVAMLRGNAERIYRI